MSRPSAVIVRVALPPDLARIRAAGDRMALLGVPPHVTVLFPWLPANALNAHVRAELTRVVRGAKPFLARFDGVDRRDGMVWLVPTDQGPFLTLTATVAARWPETPPYGGVHQKLIAHLTLLEQPDPVALDVAARAATAEGPFEVWVDSIEVIAEAGDGKWRAVWKIPLAG